MRLKAFLAVTLALALALGFFLYRSHTALAAAHARLAAVEAEKARLAAENAAAQANVLSEADLQRLRADQRDAIKLRGENATLKSAVAAAEKARDAAQKNAAAKTPTPRAANLPQDQNPYARTYQRKANAVVSMGQAVVLGDFESTPGKRTFALAIPNADPTNPQSVSIQTKWIEFSDEAKEKLGQYLTPGVSSILDQEQLAAFFKAAEQTAGVDLLSAPMVTTLSGRAASISVTESKDTPNGPIIVGPEINLTPTLGPDGSVSLAIDAKLTQQVNPDAGQ